MYLRGGGAVLAIERLKWLKTKQIPTFHVKVRKLMYIKIKRNWNKDRRKTKEQESNNPTY